MDWGCCAGHMSCAERGVSRCAYGSPHALAQLHVKLPLFARSAGVATSVFASAVPAQAKTASVRAHAMAVGGNGGMPKSGTGALGFHGKRL